MKYIFILFFSIIYLSSCAVGNKVGEGVSEGVVGIYAGVFKVAGAVVGGVVEGVVVGIEEITGPSSEELQRKKEEQIALIKEKKQKITDSKEIISSIEDNRNQKIIKLKKEKEIFYNSDNWLKFSISASKKNGSYQCNQPSSYQWRKKPKNACNNNEADKLSGAMCVASIGGPEACGLLAKNFGKKLGVSMFNFMSSTYCGALVAQINKEEYTQEDFIGDFALGMFQDYLDSLQKQGHYLEAILGNVIYYSLLLNKLDVCMKNARYSCSQLYTVWKEEDALRKGRNGKNKLYRKCQDNIEHRKNSKDTTYSIEKELKIINSKLILKNQELKKLEKELEELEKELERIEADIRIYGYTKQGRRPASVAGINVGCVLRTVL